MPASRSHRRGGRSAAAPAAARYAATCKKQAVPKLTDAEVLPYCNELATVGVFGIERAKHARTDEFEGKARAPRTAVRPRATPRA